MKIITLTDSPKEPIRIQTSGNFCYLIFNTHFQGIFSLEAEGAQVFVLGLFSTEDSFVVNIDQKHITPNTSSLVVLKSLLPGSAHFSYQGKIHIAKEASGSNASQEARGLLLSSEARFQAVPSLEILPSDVICRHQAAASPLSQESLYFLALRGLDTQNASALLQKAFLLSVTDSLQDTSLATVEKEAIAEHITHHVNTLYA